MRVWMRDILTIGFARRATPYKRGDLFFQDIERIKTISSKTGPFQIIYGGKAHPQDQGGKELIKRIFQAKESLKKEIKIAYVENYDIELRKDNDFRGRSLAGYRPTSQWKRGERVG